MSNHKGKNIVALLLAGVLTLLSPIASGAITYRDVQGFLPGNPIISETRELARGITHDTWKGLNDGGRAVVFNTFTLDGANPEAGALAWSGSVLTERRTLSSFIADARAQGLNVVGGVNGDFFNLATGTPLGILIRNGAVLSSDGSGYFAVGFKADGSVVMGNPSIQYMMYGNGLPLNAFHLNKDEGDFGPYVYSAAYGARAGSDELGVDVVVNMPDTRLVIGGAIEGVVAEVRLDAQGTPVGPGQVVLSARTGMNGYINLSQMAVGNVVRLEAKDLDGQWTGVTEAIGGLHRLLENGAPVSGLSATNINPATLIGKKPDGRVVMLEVDGRQPAWSNGISYQEGARLMLQMGCADAIVCDGGGSSTAAARLPGTVDPLLVNRPSDGTERKVSNALLLISKTPASAIPDPVTRLLPAGVAVQLHLYPGKSYLLPGSSASWSVKATDAGYHAADVPPGIVWTTDGGTFAPDGTLTAGGAPGLYTVSATAGGATGQASFIIPSVLTEIRVSPSSLTVAAGETVDLNASGYIEGIDVRGVDTSFTWTVDPAVGTVTAEGLFTAANAPESTGVLAVSWNGTGTQVPVYISRNPVDVETFESLPDWTVLLTPTGKGAVRSIRDPAKALFGDGFLRLFYDFTPKTEADKGVAGISAGPAGPPDAAGIKTLVPLVLEGKPTAIGCWVYGDEGRNWLRAKLTDASGKEADLDYTAEYNAETGKGGIDWSGWKYVEARIPKGLPTPYSLTVPLRVLCTQENMKKSGTLLFDRIRAIYGLKNDDLVPPSVDAVLPQDGGVVNSGVLTLTMAASDAAGGSGLNPEKIALSLDGVPQEGLQVSGDGSSLLVKRAFGQPVPLAGGFHVAQLHIEDRFGNKSARTWSFKVDNATPQTSLQMPDVIPSGGTFDAIVQVRNPNPLKAMTLELAWDPALLEPVDMDAKKAGVQMGLEKWVSSAKVSANAADTKAGIWRVALSGLNSTVKTVDRKILTLRFKAKATANGTALVKSGKAFLQASGLKSAQTFSFPETTILIEPAYSLDVRNVVAGGSTRLAVSDRKGSPVAGAAIYVEGSGGGPIATTDKNGIADTKAVTARSAGSRIRLRAVKAGLSSGIVQVVTGAASEGAKSLAVTISPISQPGGMTVHWLSATSSGTSVRIMETDAYSGSFTAAAKQAVATNTVTQTTDPVTNAVLYEHKAVFYGLKPETAYKWRITDGQSGNGATGGFTTPVSEAGKAFTFGFVTDPQAIDAAGYLPFRNLLQRMLGKAPDLSFLILGGDVVDNGAKPAQWWGFFQTAWQYLQSVPILAVPGNHEYMGDAKLDAYKAFWGLPATGPANFAETAYTVLNGDARFYMLDTQGNLDEQLAWLKKEKAASSSKWNIVVMHRGIYGGFYDESAYRKKVAPVFDELGMDLVLSGHDHTWLRTTMKAGKKVPLGTGTTYVAGGASGGKFYDAPKRSWTEVLFDGNTPSFTLVTVSPDKLVVSASHVEGAKTVRHDEFTIRK